MFCRNYFPPQHHGAIPHKLVCEEKKKQRVITEAQNPPQKKCLRRAALFYRHAQEHKNPPNSFTQHNHLLMWLCNMNKYSPGFASWRLHSFRIKTCFRPRGETVSAVRLVSSFPPFSCTFALKTFPPSPVSARHPSRRSHISTSAASQPVPVCRRWQGICCSSHRSLQLFWESTKT